MMFFERLDFSISSAISSFRASLTALLISIFSGVTGLAGKSLVMTSAYDFLHSSLMVDSIDVLRSSSFFSNSFSTYSRVWRAGSFDSLIFSSESFFFCVSTISNKCCSLSFRTLITFSLSIILQSALPLKILYVKYM